MDQESDRQRRQMVEQLRRGGWIRSEAVEKAILQVPRHMFVQPLEERLRRSDLSTRAYDLNSPICIRLDPTAPDHGPSSISAPTMVAEMLEQLELWPGMRTLEIGAGSGYNAALLASVVGQDAVCTIEQYADVAEAARQRLQVAGLGGLDVISGDGGEGYAGRSPYERIIATASVKDIPPAWLDQLRLGGVLVTPWRLASGPQGLLKARACGPNVLEGRLVHSVGFMGLHGAHGHPQSEDMWELSTMAELREVLAEPLVVKELPVHVPDSGSRGGSGREYGLLFFVCLEESSIRRVELTGDSSAGMEEAGSDPWLALWMPHRASLAIVCEDVRKVLCYGNTVAYERLLELAEAWKAYGEPEISDFSVTVHRRHPGQAVPAGTGKTWRLELAWNTWKVGLAK